MLDDEIALRAGAPEDMEFLFALLRDALGPYVAETYGGWHDAEQRARFFARPRAEAHQIVEQRGRPIGCLLVERTPGSIELKRVFLLPALHDRGIGSGLIRNVLDQARAVRLPVRLQVLRVNHRARRLYERLGFAVIGETETHVQMEHPA